MHMAARWLRLTSGVCALCMIVGCGTTPVDTNEGEQSNPQAEALIAKLQSDSQLAALDAQTRLKTMGEAALPALKAFAIGPKAKGQREAVRLIGEIGGETAAQFLVEILINAELHLKTDVQIQLSACGEGAIAPLVDAIADADDMALFDIQPVLMLLDQKAAIDKMIEGLYKHRRSKAHGTPEVAQYRLNTVRVLRALTAQTFGFNQDATEDEQRKVMEKWVIWWRQNKADIQLD